MKKTDFIPKAKLSKKKRQELNRAKRITWDHSPVTRVIPSKKKEKQEKAARSDQTDSDGFSLYTPNKAGGCDNCPLYFIERFLIIKWQNVKQIGNFAE